MIPTPDKRQKKDLIRKAERIGELLGMDPVPSFKMAWKEPRLELETAECYPLIDVLERLAEKIVMLEPVQEIKPKKKGGRPKKKVEEDAG